MQPPVNDWTQLTPVPTPPQFQPPAPPPPVMQPPVAPYQITRPDGTLPPVVQQPPPMQQPVNDWRQLTPVPTPPVMQPQPPVIQPPPPVMQPPVMLPPVMPQPVAQPPVMAKPKGGKGKGKGKGKGRGRGRGRGRKAAGGITDIGYQAGGLTEEMISDPITQETIKFITGESGNQEIVNEFLQKYGNEAFIQLREAVLQQIAPNAQTEGLISGNGNGGMTDDISGTIGNRQDIAVSQDEFIVPADVVSQIGDGSSNSGAKELYAMMDRVRKEKTGTTQQAPRLASAGGYLPA